MKFNLVIGVGLLLAVLFSGFSDAQFNFLGFRLPSFRRPQMPRMPRLRTFMRNIFSSPTSRPAAISSPVQQSASVSTRPASSSIPISSPVQSSSPVLEAIATPDNAIDVTSPIQQAAPPQSNAGGSGSGNHQYQGRSYLLTWRTGQNGFSHSAARSFCRSRGMRIVSLDSISKATHFMDLLERDNAPYFWAGGRTSSDKGTLSWENGRSERIIRGRFPWSTEGLRGPQPDGGQGSELCLAILNNVYNDRVKFHDVGCSHRKPTICEQI